MILILAPTDKFYTTEEGSRARAWVGRTEAGTEITALIVTYATVRRGCFACAGTGWARQT